MILKFNNIHNSHQKEIDRQHQMQQAQQQAMAAQTAQNIPKPIKGNK